ncbi:MAG: DUF4172 domain-containing protein [Kiritimatiellae bacterium]|nr:DUF4172 domain-containing protein [Kiritimatiellia bacterium]
MRYIQQQKNWPCFRWDVAEIEADLVEASFRLGRFSGRLNAIGFDMHMRQETVRFYLLSAQIQNGI